MFPDEDRSDQIGARRCEGDAVGAPMRWVGFGRGQAALRQRVDDRLDVLAGDAAGSGDVGHCGGAVVAEVFEDGPSRRFDQIAGESFGGVGQGVERQTDFVDELGDR